VGGYDPHLFWGYAPEDQLFWNKIEYFTSIETAENPRIPFIHLWHPNAGSLNPLLRKMEGFNELIKKRNSLVTQINNIYNLVKTLTSILGITNTIISVLQIGIQIAKANPYPSTGIPPLGLPPLTSGAQTSIASFVAALETQLKSLGKTLNVITITVGSFGILLGIILKLLEALDMLLQECAGTNAMSLTAINDEINALANPTVEATQNDNNDNNIYKGFTLGVKIDETNESKYIKRYAVAQNKQGIPVLRTESSFASDPAILISQLKFIIDSTPNITAE
jgi:hypothetical protein